MACKENSRSKNYVPGKRLEVVPSTMELGDPGELLCIVFGAILPLRKEQKKLVVFLKQLKARGRHGKDVPRD